MKHVAPLIFSAPVLLGDQSSAAFESFKNRFLGLVKPADVLEEVWANDFIVLAWEIELYRAMKAALIKSARTIALVNLLALMKGDSFAGGAEERNLASDWFDNPDSRKQILELLRSRDLTEAAIDAEALRLRLQDVEKIEARIASAQSRRDRVLQQISDYRSFFAQLLQDAGKTIEH